jgi:AbrB family looped-hinge helix DNA binding protein
MEAMPMVKKGHCMKDAMVYGVATVSEKGQIVIPVQIRKELGLNGGDKLLIVKRKDNAGFTFIDLKMMDKLIERIRADEEFFEKL